jgi:hypothetical protein
MTIDELLAAGAELRNTEIGSTGFEMWLDDVKEFVVPYGERKMELFEQASRISHVIMGGRSLNDERYDSTKEFLESLRRRSVEDSRAQDAIINQKQTEAAASLRQKFGNLNVNGGNVTFGDSSPINQVTVGELMAGLIKEAEAMPDGPEKQGLLSRIKQLTTDPTFSTLSGVGLSALLTKVLTGGQN